MKTPRLLSLLLVILGPFHSAIAGPPSDQEIAAHPALRLDPVVVRKLIVATIASDAAIQRELGPAAIGEALPASIDLCFPDPSPYFMVSSWRDGPFAKLGDWVLVFGPDKRDVDEGNKFIDHFTLRRIVYTKKSFDGQPGGKTKCVRLVIEPVLDEPVQSWKLGRIVLLTLSGWYLQEFIFTEKTDYADTDHVRYLRGGGVHSQIEKEHPGVLSTHILEPAFRGYILRQPPR